MDGSAPVVRVVTAMNVMAALGAALVATVVARMTD